MFDVPIYRLCTLCDRVSLNDLWKDCTIYCEDCGGEHQAIRCPECDEAVDLVFTDFVLKNSMYVPKGYKSKTVSMEGL